MVIFASEADLIAKLLAHDELVRRCVAGELPFDRFRDEYNNFYARYALDGHEADDEERALLAKYHELIEPHRIITLEILGRLCSDTDAATEAYRKAGRFGSAGALVRLSGIKVGASP